MTVFSQELGDDDTDTKSLVDLTRRLVDVPSVSGSEEKVLGMIRGLHSERLEAVHDEDSVYLAVGGPRHNDRPLVILAGHTDTVPISGNVPSRTDGNIIYGCGTADMKGGLAVALEIDRWISESRAQLDFDLGLLLFGREELQESDNPLPGAIAQCPTIQHSDLVIVMEPTSSSVEAGCLGNLNITIQYKGMAAHSARPWLGRNSAHMAIESLSDFAKMSPVDRQIEGLTFREVANITSIRGGTARNVIPASTEVDINVRFAPGQDTDELVARWHRMLSGDDIEVEITSVAEGAYPKVNTELTQRLITAAGSEPRPKQAWTNIADFAAAEIPAINFGPGDPAFAHKADEQISGTELLECFRTLQRFFLGLSA